LKAGLLGLAILAAIVGMGLLELGGIPKGRHGWLVALVVAPLAWLVVELLGELVSAGMHRLPFPRWAQVLAFYLIVLLVFIGYYTIRSWLVPNAPPWWDSFRERRSTVRPEQRVPKWQFGDRGHRTEVQYLRQRRPFAGGSKHTAQYCQ
jgi:hypothetical protein